MRSAMLRFPFNLVTSCLCSKPPFILRSLDRRLISLILSAQRSSSSSSDLALGRAKNASMTRPFCVKRMRRESRAVDRMQCRKFASLHPSQTCNFRPAYPIPTMGLSGSEGTVDQIFAILHFFVQEPILNFIKFPFWNAVE